MSKAKDKKQYEVGDKYFITTDYNAEEPIDKVRFWSRSWNKTKLTGEIMVRLTVIAGKVAGVAVRMTVSDLGKISVGLGKLVLLFVKKSYPTSDTQVVYHRDGDSTNNLPGNLKWVEKKDIAALTLNKDKKKKDDTQS